MTMDSATVLPFSLADRWIVTVEPERRFVRRRHRTDWWTVCRRKGEEDRRWRSASRADALWLAEQMREHFERQALADEIEAQLSRLPPMQRERAMTKLWTLAAEDGGPDHSPT